MIGEWVRKKTSVWFRWVAHRLVDAGISANAVTALGLLLSGVAACLAAAGRHLAAGLVLVAAGLLDGLDGSVARASDRQSQFGAFWDSTLDRLSESVVCLGVLVYFVQMGSTVGVILVYLATVGSLLVSYCRARAEGLGISCRTGFMTRFERVFVLTAGLILGQLIVAMGLLAVLSFFTVVQRMYVVWSAVHQPAKATGGVAVFGRGGKQR